MYLKTSNGPSLVFEEIRYELQAYIAFKRIPKSIRTRILTFYDYSFKNKFYRKEELHDLMGSGIKKMITTEKCLPYLKRNRLFQIIPIEMLRALAGCLRESLYLKNDVISRNDQHRGQVRMYSLPSFMLTSFLVLLS